MFFHLSLLGPQQFSEQPLELLLMLDAFSDPSHVRIRVELLQSTRKHVSLQDTEFMFNFCASLLNFLYLHFSDSINLVHVGLPLQEVQQHLSDLLNKVCMAKLHPIKFSLSILFEVLRLLKICQL